MKIRVVGLLLLLLISQVGKAQDWLKNLPEGKLKGDYTFYDYQNAFYSYWEPFNVKLGYYYVDGVKKKAYGWKQFKRWEHNVKYTIDPLTGAFSTKSPVLVYAQYKKEHTTQKSENASAWTSLGSAFSDGGYAGVGRLTSVTFHPNDPSTYWAGSAGGGVWKTSDDGNSWTVLTDEIGTLMITDVVVPSDYATSNTIYIATGDKDIYWDSHSIGVLKSTDGGVNWLSTDLTFAVSNNEIISKLLIDPTNDQILLAATSNGVYKTTDGGTTWNTQLSSINFIDLEYKPGDFSVLYGSTSSGVIYRSTNGGSSWQIVYTNSDAYRVELAVTPADPTMVYALIANDENGLYGIYKSTDQGLNFSMIFDGNTANMLSYSSDGSGTGGQAWYDLALAVSPLDENTVILGGINAWRSTDGGNNWNIMSHWWGDGVQAVHADKHLQKFRPDGQLFECNDGGMYISSDGGESWEDRTNGMIIGQLYRLGLSKTNADEIITGLQDNGTKLLSSGSWIDVKGGDGMECIIDPDNIDIQYGTYVEGQISKTYDHWQSETEIQPADAGSGSWVTPYVMDPTNSSILYAGYAEVWKTYDGGFSWEQVSNFSNSSTLEAMAISPSNPNVIYVADNNTIWRTNAGGGTWTDITSGLPVSSSGITYIAVKNDDPNTLWVTFGSFNNKKVYQSINAGANWTNISTGLPQLPVYTIVQNVQSAGVVQLFVGTEVGVFVKEGATDWQPYDTDLPNVKVNELEIFYAPQMDDCRLRAATYGRGLWETPLSVAGTPLSGIATTTKQCIASSNLLKLIGYSGDIQWQQSTDGINWSAVTQATGATTATMSIANLTQQVSFRAKVTLGASSPVYSNSITIYALPLVTMETVEDVCFSDSAFVLNTGTPSGGTYSGTGVSGGKFIPTATSIQTHTLHYSYTDSHQCTSTAQSTIKVMDCGTIPEYTVETYLLYPNPVSDILTLFYNPEKYTEVKLMDRTGRVVLTNVLSNAENKAEFNVKRFAAGIYTLQLISSEGIEKIQLSLIGQ